MIDKFEKAISKTQKAAIYGALAGVFIQVSAFGAQMYAYSSADDITEPNADCTMPKAVCIDERRHAHKEAFMTVVRPTMLSGAALALVSTGAGFGAGKVRRDAAKLDSAHTPS
jgi:hypothetical protein